MTTRSRAVLRHVSAFTQVAWVPFAVFAFFTLLSMTVVLGVFGFRAFTHYEDPAAMKYDAEYQSWCEGRTGILVYDRYRRPTHCYVFTIKKG